MSDRNPTIERPQGSPRDQRDSFPQRFPQVTATPSVLPDAPFGEMVGFAFKWLLAITIASLFIEVPIGLILYFALR
jgi:tetrahydromethanopterin S-methyltransferase subunit B